MCFQIRALGWRDTNRFGDGEVARRFIPPGSMQQAYLAVWSFSLSGGAQREGRCQLSGLPTFWLLDQGPLWNASHSSSCPARICLGQNMPETWINIGRCFVHSQAIHGTGIVTYMRIMLMGEMMVCNYSSPMDGLGFTKMFPGSTQNSDVRLQTLRTLIVQPSPTPSTTLNVNPMALCLYLLWGRQSRVTSLIAATRRRKTSHGLTNTTCFDAGHTTHAFSGCKRVTWSLAQLAHVGPWFMSCKGFTAIPPFGIFLDP